jgi:hypothetical protein
MVAVHELPDVGSYKKYFLQILVKESLLPSLLIEGYWITDDFLYVFFLHKCLLIHYMYIPSLMTDECVALVITECSPGVVVSKNLCNCCSMNTNFNDIRIIYHMFYRLLCL